jgi:hypothetical protein
VQWKVSDGGNGHWYEAVIATGTWTDAQSAASVAGGYLATVTSEGENNFIYSLVTNWDNYWFNEGNVSLGPWLGVSGEGVQI